MRSCPLQGFKGCPNKVEECLIGAIDIIARAAVLDRDIPAMFLAHRDRMTSLLTKLMAFPVDAYALSPIGLIPDFVPVLGYLDDLIVLPALRAFAIRLIPHVIFKEYRSKKDVSMTRHWYYAIPVIIVYTLLVFIIVKAVFL